MNDLRKRAFPQPPPEHHRRKRFFERGFWASGKSSFLPEKDVLKGFSGRGWISFGSHLEEIGESMERIALQRFFTKVVVILAGTGECRCVLLEF
jgi:hypothetical protein